MVTRAAMGLAVVGVLATGCTQWNPLLPTDEPWGLTSEPGGPDVLRDADAWVVDVDNVVSITPDHVDEDSIRTSFNVADPDGQGYSEAHWRARVVFPVLDIELVDAEVITIVGAPPADAPPTRYIALFHDDPEAEVHVALPPDAPATGYALVGPWRADW